MRSRVLWVCCVLMCLASMVGWASSAQDSAVEAIAVDEEVAVPIESDVVDGERKIAPIEFFPIPEGTVFEPLTVWADGVDEAEANAVAGLPEQLIFSNTLGTFGANLGQGNLVSDDITTIVPADCKLRRFTFPVTGKVNPAGLGGPYIINFAFYSSCPGSVPIGSQPTLIIPGTQGQKSIINECQNSLDDDTDGSVNDGCPTVGPAESGAQCANNTDDDADGRINDGCPVVGSPELDADVPRLITFIAGANVPLPTNFWFGVKFNRGNAGVLYGAPPLTGFSCDQNDYPGAPCTAWAGGFPEQPHASFNLDVYADSACTNSYTGYKNNNPSGSTYNPSPGVTFADDIELITAPPPAPPPTTVCNMIAYEVAVRGDSNYTFDLRRNCDGSVIAGTQREFSIFKDPNPRIARFTFSPAIPLPNNFFLSATISAASGGVIVSGQPACIGRTADAFQVALPNGCTPTVFPPPETGLPRIHAAFSAAITCAGAAPLGACCDMFQTDPQGEAVCRLVPEVNCPYPPKDQALKPEWVQGAGCTKCDDALDDDGDGFVNDGCPAVGAAESGAQCSNAVDNDSDGVVNDGCPVVGTAEPGDPFLPEPCGVAACCKPDGTCQNLTRNQCFAVPPLNSPRQWQRGRYCNRDGQRCPRIACLARTGECTLPRCVCPCGESCLFPPPCSVGPACCDSCPPVGCDDSECCTDVCAVDSFCCDVEWDDTCAASARTICNVRPGNDVCKPTGRLEGARLMTTGPPGNTAETDHGRCTADPGDPGFGCFLNSPGTRGLQTAWYRFVATHTTALVQTCNSNSPANDSLVSVYAVGNPTDRNTQCDTLIPVGCSDDASGCSSGGKNAKVCVRNLVVGNWYYILVASKIEVADGVAYRVDITSPCTTPVEGTLNNYCPGAAIITRCLNTTDDDADTKVNDGCPAVGPAEVDQCQNAVDDDADSAVNDGCVAVGAAESGTNCQNAVDNDGDGKVNDGCPAVGPAEVEQCQNAVDNDGDGVVNDGCPAVGPAESDNLVVTAFNLGGTCPTSCPETLDAPVEACIPLMEVDEWYKYTASCTGQLTVDTCGSTPGVGPDTNLAIYDGDICPQLTASPAPLACSEDAGNNCGQSGQGSKVVVDVEEGNIYKIRLGDSAGNLPSGSLKVACAQAPCPAGNMTFTNPPNGVVDAGRPHDPIDAAALQGIQTVIATGPPDAEIECFSVCQSPDPGNPNPVAMLVQDPVGTYAITLTRPIHGGSLTTVTYTDIHGKKSTGRFTSAPANVNADFIALASASPPTPSDVQFLLDALNGIVLLPWGDYSGDINRSLITTGADLLEVIDLLQGNGEYEPWDFTFNPSESTDCPLP